MEKRKLGKYGADVSAIGIGAMSFSNFYGPTNEQESHTRSEERRVGKECER